MDARKGNGMKLVGLSVAVVLASSVLYGCSSPVEADDVESNILSVPSVSDVYIQKVDSRNPNTPIAYNITLEHDLGIYKSKSASKEVADVIAAYQDEGAWSLHVRNDDYEVGISSDVYSMTIPQEIPTIEEAPDGSVATETNELATPLDPIDSFGSQYSVAYKISKLDGVEAFSLFDGLAGYMEISITDQSLIEEYTEQISTILDESDFRNKGTFAIVFNVLDKDGNDVRNVRQSIRIEIDYRNEDSDGFWSKSIIFPTESIGLYRSLLSAEGVAYKEITLRSLNAHQELYVTIAGRRDNAAYLAVNNLIHKADPERYMETKVEFEL